VQHARTSSLAVKEFSEFGFKTVTLTKVPRRIGAVLSMSYAVSPLYARGYGEVTFELFTLNAQVITLCDLGFGQRLAPKHACEKFLYFNQSPQNVGTSKVSVLHSLWHKP